MAHNEVQFKLDQHFKLIIRNTEKKEAFLLMLKVVSHINYISVRC